MKKRFFVLLSAAALVAAAMGGITAAEKSGQAISGRERGAAFSLSDAGAYRTRVELMGERYLLDYSFLEPVVEFYEGGLRLLAKLNAPAVKYFYETGRATGAVIREYRK